MTTFVRYVMLGAAGFGLGLFLTWALHNLAGMTESQAVAATLAVLFVFNFFMARAVVFKVRHNITRQGLRFLAVSLSMRLLEYGLFMVLFHLVEVYYLLAYTASILIVFVLKYGLYKKVVFDPGT